MTALTLVRRVPPTLGGAPLRAGLIGFGTTLALAIVLFVVTSVAIGVAHDGRVLRGVTVSGIPIGGMDRAAAAEQLRGSLPQLGATQITLRGNGETMTVSAAQLGRGYDIDATLDEAFRVGRNGSLFTSSVVRLRSLVSDTALAPEVVPYESAAFDRVAARLAALIEREASGAAVLTNVEAGYFEVRLGVEGIEVDRAALAALLKSELATLDGADLSVEVPLIRSTPEFTTRQAAAAALAGNRVATQIGLLVEDDEFTIERTTMIGWVSLEPAEGGGFNTVIDEAAVGEHVAALAATVDREAKDASFTHGRSAGPTGVTPGQSGRTVDVEKTTADLLAALRGRAAGRAIPTIPLTATLVLPDLSTEEAEAALPRMEKLSSWTTYYVPGVANYWSRNISIPAWRIDGTTVAPGEWFDFWEGIGGLESVTVANGYGQGGAIINGRTQLTGALAGGICSTSTTLFNAAARAGYEIGERENHSYYISRYPLGLDATVFADAGWVTSMKFRNDTAAPLMIRGYGAPGWVTFEIWSVPTERRVVLTRPVTWGYRSAGWTTTVDSSLAPGQRVVDQEPHDGFNAQVERYVYDADGTAIHHDTWYSDYRMVTGIVRVGPEA